MRLLEALRIEGANIDAELQRSNLFSQMGDRGEFREKIVEGFLRPFLPPCYGLGAGEVFSLDGQQSAQVDIVVYDAVFSTVLFQSGSRRLFPAESIFGSIEVKSNLSSAELDRACANVASVKRLNRLRGDSLDLLPHLRLKLGGPLTGGGDFRNPYIGIVFGYSGVQPGVVVQDLMGRLSASPAQKQLLPDFIFVRTPGYMIVRCRDRTPVPPGQDFTGFGRVVTGVDTLPLFFLTLNLCLGQVRLRQPDFDALWIQTVSGYLTPTPNVTGGLP